MQEQDEGPAFVLYQWDSIKTINGDKRNAIASLINQRIIGMLAANIELIRRYFYNIYN